MHLLNFITRFSGDIECFEYFRKIREHAGFECNNCGSRHHIWDDRMDQFRCIRCEDLIPLKTGTALEGSALPIKYWLLAAYLLTCEDKTYTVTDIHRNIDYMGSAEVDKMLGRLDIIMKSIGCPADFEMLLLACATNGQRDR